MAIGERVYCVADATPAGEPQEKSSGIDTNGEDTSESKPAQSGCSTSESHELVIKNLTMKEEARLGFQEVEMKTGKLRLENIPELGDTCFRFKKICEKRDEDGLCPSISVEIRNCTLKGVLELGNIEQLHFCDFENLGRIISTSPDGVWGGLKERDWLVKAVLNHLNEYKKTLSEDVDKVEKYHWEVASHAKDLSLLKKNYENMGLNDAEDDALVAYMDNNYCPNGKRSKLREKCVFPLLKNIGKYGTAPELILWWLVVLCTILIVPFVVGLIVHLKTWSFMFVPISIGISIANILPFSSVFYSLLSIPEEYTRLPIVLVISAMESVLSALLIGYFAIAIVRKYMR